MNSTTINNKPYHLCLEPNCLIHGDNLLIMQDMPDETINLIYIDPPFFTNSLRDGTNRSNGDKLSYSDIWRGGMTEYLEWLSPRLSEMRRLLKPNGSIFIHLDWRAVHYVKVLMDNLYGYDCFQNEIIWHYETGGASRFRFSRKHDTILWYSRSSKAWKYYGERIKIPRSAGAVKRAENPKGARLAKGDIYKNPNDVIILQQLNPMSNERIGYPTQKPLELLMRLIEVASDEGDIVADFFCGSGSTAIACHILKRKWLTSDIAEAAIRITQHRLALLNLSLEDYLVVDYDKISKK